MKIGDKVDILQGCGGPWGSYQQCESPVTVTEKNIDVLDALLRGGLVAISGPDKSKVEEIKFSGDPKPDASSDILPDSPKTRKRSPKLNPKSNGD
jgi:hypothetical protein